MVYSCSVGKIMKAGVLHMEAPPIVTLVRSCSGSPNNISLGLPSFIPLALASSSFISVFKNPRSHLVGCLVREHPLPDWCQPGEYQCQSSWPMIHGQRLLHRFLGCISPIGNHRFLKGFLLAVPILHPDLMRIKWIPVLYLKSPELPKRCQPPRLLQLPSKAAGSLSKLEELPRLGRQM